MVVTETKTRKQRPKTPLRKRRLLTKTKIHYENEDPPYENEGPLRKRRHITKKSSKEVGITFVDKDYVHETPYENEDPYGNMNSEFGTSVIQYGLFQQ